MRPSVRSSTSRSNPLRRPITAGTFLCCLFGTVVALAICVSLLPHDRYVRFQSLRGSIHARAEWVYDRLHFDPTPVDVLIVGPSRTVTDIDGPQMQALLQERTGTRIGVANLGYAEPGLNLMYLMAREAFRTKQPKVVVVGILEHQVRDGHPAFKDLAEPGDFLDAPVFAKRLEFFNNLAFLPMRQLRLFFDTVLGRFLGFYRGFDAASYPGPDIDVEATYPVHSAQGPSASELEKQAAVLTNTVTHPYLPARFGDLEFAADRIYLKRIAELASAHHAKLVFVYLPLFKGPDKPIDSSYYAKLGPLLLPPDDIRSDLSNYFDAGHMTDLGRRRFTGWLAEELVPAVADGPSARDTPELGQEQHAEKP